METLIARFFQDPEWPKVEEMILRYVLPLSDMSTIDLTQPAEHVKAEVIGRIRAYESLTKFLSDTKLINRPIKAINNPFK